MIPGPNATLTSNWDGTTKLENTTVTYTCDPGLQTTNGTTEQNQTCTSNGWVRAGEQTCTSRTAGYGPGNRPAPPTAGYGPGNRPAPSNDWVRAGLTIDGPDQPDQPGLLA